MSDNDLIRRGDALALCYGYGCDTADRIAALPVVTEHKLIKAMRVIEAIVEDEGYIPKRVESDYLDLYKTLDESL